MTPEEFYDKMVSLRVDDGDVEMSHSNMDELMAQVLTSLGYGKGIDVWDSSSKWYA